MFARKLEHKTEDVLCFFGFSFLFSEQNSFWSPYIFPSTSTIKICQEQLILELDMLILMILVEGEAEGELTNRIVQTPF